VNIFNVYYLEEVAGWIDKISASGEIEFIYWNVLHDAPVHCITSFPKTIKTDISDKLLNADVNEVFKEEFKNIVEFMRTNSDITTDDIINNIKTMDERKGDNFSDSHLELALLLGLIR